MSKYDPNGQLKCLLTPCEKCSKLKKQNSELKKKFNREKRWVNTLLRVHFGDELTPAQQKEFGFLVSKL